ncbi:hypothetical protein BS47DRAFT_1386466 [Hydnum rufescens UP504]|uniref:Uncharacterized protein n=1 Tax=Hydnum rufescens UP504 TaxID=1448309 RepID=A0A9P6ACU6_9AGAM|nr:hypothetical protein BS47DRAFT_1386466 [Hydnum rufescens UP504]
MTVQHSNAPNEDAPNEDMTHGNATHGNTTYGNVPNKHMTMPNEAPGTTHPPWQVTTSCANEYLHKNPHNPACQHLNEGTCTNPCTCELEYSSSTPHPLQWIGAPPTQDDNP